MRYLKEMESNMNIIPFHAVAYNNLKISNKKVIPF